MREAAVPAHARVPTRTLLRVFLRSFFLQAAWNPRGMQNLGFAHAISPALEVLYPDRRARAAAVRRHLEFFNCHPYLAAAILGGAVYLEERVAAGLERPEAVSRFKSTLGPPFAALGDGFFWLALRPAAALLAAATAPLFGLASVFLFLVAYNAVHLPARAWLFAAGYRRGEGVVEAVRHAHLALATSILKGTAALMAGALSGRAVLVAWTPHRHFHAALVAALIILAFAWLPRMSITRAVYIALGVGLALGGGFL